MNTTTHQEKEKNEETKKGRRKKSENRQPILKKLCAALPQSFRGQHSKIMKGSAWGNWDPRERPTAISTQPERGQKRHHHVEAAVDWCSSEMSPM